MYTSEPITIHSYKSISYNHISKDVMLNPLFDNFANSDRE